MVAKDVFKLGTVGETELTVALLAKINGKPDVSVQGNASEGLIVNVPETDINTNTTYSKISQANKMHGGLTQISNNLGRQ